MNPMSNDEFERLESCISIDIACPSAGGGVACSQTGRWILDCSKWLVVNGKWSGVQHFSQGIIFLQ